MKEYIVELLDTKDHILFATTVLAETISLALEQAKIRAYHQMDKHNIVIRYVSVKNEKTHYVYNMLTKKNEKWY